MGDSSMKQTRKIYYFPLQGGEDLVTPVFSKKPGTLSASRNFECDQGGRYRRIDGYERFDGQPSPADADYWVLSFKSGTVEISVGDTVTDAFSGATGEALADAVIESGAYGDSDAAGYLVLGSVVGDFSLNHSLQVSAATVALAAGSDLKNSASSTNHDTWTHLAIEALRAEIAAVPGSGDILGVAALNQVVYAFRNNAGDTAADLYKSTTSGWSKVDLGEELRFDAGTDALIVGETLTGGSSGATGTIKRVIVQTGDWSTNDAAGYIILHSVVSGPFTDNETIAHTTPTGSADADGINTAITLTKDGRYDFDVYNFYGHSSTKKIYGCDGKNNGFEFDGTTYVPIYTGMVTDTPQHIKAMGGYLFFSFVGGSLQFSSVGEPTEWSALTGAAEIGLGDEIVGLETLKDNVLAVIGETRVSVLYYDSGWALKSFSQKFGGKEWSLQKGTELYFLNAAGISSMAATDAFGDFESAPISAVVKPMLQAKLGDFISSISIRNKEHIRFYFSDKTGVNVTFDGNTPIGFTQLLYLHKVCCTCETITADGADFLLYGSDNGMVYHLDKGTSFDGAAVESFFRTWVISLGNPERKKRFFKLSLEKDGTMTEGYWEVGKWGLFEWGLQAANLPHSYVDETGTGYEYGYYASETYETPYTLQGVILHYSEGGLNR